VVYALVIVGGGSAETAVGEMSTIITTMIKLKGQDVGI
jgi:hypothetical protein